MKEVTVPFPDIEVNCPDCNAGLIAPGYECTPYSDGFARCVVHCEDCDIEFLTIIGD